MNEPSDTQLLHDYAEHRSEAAFATLVRRHIDLVHSAAVRMVNDVHLAQDVSQAVFVAMAKDAGKITKHPVLAGWLHRTTRNIASQSIRSDVRRRNREHASTAMNEAPESNAVWEEIAPHLDAALGELSTSDRNAVLLRYFENKPAREMSEILGVSAEAAQKRVSRAVEKLRKSLKRRGITAGAAGLAGAISANAVQTAPVGLASAIAGSAAATVIGGATTKALAMTMMQKIWIVIVITLIGGVAVYQVFLRPNLPGLEVERAEQPAFSERPENGGRSLVEQISKARDGKPPVDRKKELARLKERWLEVGLRNEKVLEQNVLAQESANLLMCSREMLELVAFLEFHEMHYAVAVTYSAVEALFNTARAAEARKLLVDLPETAKFSGERSYASGGFLHRNRWSFAAGKTCPDGEFEAFRAALNSESSAQEALYGRNVTLMATDPQAAFDSSLQTFMSGIPSASGRNGVIKLFDVESAATLDFARCEERIPPNGLSEKKGVYIVEEDAFTAIRRNLFRAWTKVAPAAAANHVLAHPDRLPPELMKEIVGAFGQSFANRVEVIEWVSGFPEGPYFDAAASAAAIYARGAPELNELIQKIQNPEMRQQAMKQAEVPLSNPKTR